MPMQPILRNLPSDSDMTKALLLGIALASNMGGAASPIASPQNLIALENMLPQPGWGTWFFIALPVCIISILLIWILLLVTFRPGRNTTIVPIRPMKDKFTGVQWFITIVTLVTIALWCVSHQLEHIFGDMGVIAIIPIVLFFGTGILTKEDFNNFLWTIIILAAGGLALGKAVNSSGLLKTIAVSITAQVSHLPLYGIVCAFAALIGVVATFISHTVAALIVLPLVREVGAGMENPAPNLLVMISVLMASAAMGLPTSGFPNMSKSFHPKLKKRVTNTPRSCNHDGRLANGTALLAGQAFPDERHSSQYDGVWGDCHCWIWVVPRRWVLMIEILACKGFRCRLIEHLDWRRGRSTLPLNRPSQGPLHRTCLLRDPHLPLVRQVCPSRKLSPRPFSE